MEIKVKEEIQKMYLEGSEPKDIAKKKKIPLKDVKAVLNQTPETNTKLEKKYLMNRLAKESDKILRMKEKFYDGLDMALDEFLQSKNKMAVMDQFKGLIDSMDKTFRLNEGMATANNASEHTEKKITLDVAETLKQLKTPEQKRKFLKAQVMPQETKKDEDDRS